MLNIYNRIGLAIWSLFFSAMAWAQPAPPASSDEILQKTGANDASLKILKQVFGESFVNSPLTSLGANTDGSLLASMFVIFNICLFAVGLIWLSYTIGAGIAQTAHEGEALGKRFSSLWLPIRIVTGVAGIIPIFSGFSAFQALLMFLGLVGIGVSNWIWTTTIDVSSDNFQGLTQASAASPQPNVSLADTYRSMFFSNVCKGLYDSYSGANGDSGSIVGDSTKIERRVIEAANPKIQREGFTYGTQKDRALCGAWSFSTAFTENGGNSLRRSDQTSALAFRVNSVDYTQINQMAGNTAIAYRQEMYAADTRMEALANQWVTARINSMVNNTEPPVFPKEQIQAEAAASNARIKANIKRMTGDVKAISDSAGERMKELGWVGAGAWFSTFAEVNAAIADSVRNIEVETSLPLVGSRMMDSYVQEGMNALALSVKNREAVSSATAENPSSNGSLFDFINGDTDACKITGVDSQPTGNCSFGQATVDILMTGFARDTGGAGLINPIIMFKNIGDYILGTASTVVIGGAAAAGGAKALEWATPIGRFFSGAKTVAEGLGGDKKKAAEGALGGMLGKLMETFAGMVTILFIAGLAMSIYLPFVPFIVWIGALIQYFTIFVEGIMSAPIWAFTHLDPNGDGMGQRTERGYLFALNMLMRPALMVMSFFIASGLMIAIGTLTAVLFIPAMANVQGNSITGLFSIFGLLLVFFFINVTLIHSLFNLVFIVPDQVLNWVGGNNGVDLGRQTDDKINAAFISSGNSVYKLAGGGLAGRAPGGKGKGGGDGGGDGGGTGRAGGQASGSQKS